MKKNNKLSQDELRQKIDGFSIENNINEGSQESFKIVDQPIYKTHSADYDEVKNKR